MNIIAAVDRNWAIGKDNNLLVRIPEDMEFFKSTTYGKVVIMGRKTLESLPGGKPLEGRKNLVLSDTYINEDNYPNLKVFREIETLKRHVDMFYKSSDVFVIGGESIYKQFIDDCDVAYITYIDKSFDNPDTYFPYNLDMCSDWKLANCSLYRKYKKPKYKFQQIISNMLLVTQKISPIEDEYDEFPYVFKTYSRYYVCKESNDN